MGVAKVTFASAGKRSQHSKPGAYSRNESVPRAQGQVSSSNLVLIGPALGGKPAETYWFSDYAEATHVLKGGDLLNGVKCAFSPGGELKPQYVGTIRVNSATQAAATLKKTAADIIDLKTIDYGNLVNQTQYKLEAGATGKKFSEKYRTLEYFQDNIKRESLKIQYIGAGTAATITINGTNITTTVTGGPGGEDLTLVYASFPDIEAVVSYINGQAAYTAEVISGQEKAASNELDYITAQDIKTAEITLVSDVQALIDTINESTYFEATLHSGANRDVPDNVATFTYMSGGTEGANTATEWTAILTAIQQKNIQLLGGMTEDSAIQALIKAHIETTNSVTGKSELKSIVGATAQTLAGAKITAAAMNNSAIATCYKKFKWYDYNNVAADFTSMHYAAQLLGQASALDLNVPMTYKHLNDTDLSYTDCGTLTEIEEAIEAGVIVAEKTPAGIIRTVRSVTSYQSNDLKFNEFSIVRQMLFISRDLRTAAEDLFIGKAGKGEVYESVKMECSSKLGEYTESGYLVTYGGQPAWKDFSLVIDGDVLRIKWTGNVSAPINFIFITNRFDVLVSE
jgi:hypothetical protein